MCAHVTSIPCGTRIRPGAALRPLHPEAGDVKTAFPTRLNNVRTDARQAIALTRQFESLRSDGEALRLNRLAELSRKKRAAHCGRMHGLGRIGSVHSLLPREKYLAPSRPRANRRCVGIRRKPLLPARRQRHAASLDPLKHPRKRNVRERPRLLAACQLTSDIAVRTAKPDLLHGPLAARFAFPENWPKGFACLVEGQGMKPMPDMVT